MRKVAEVEKVVKPFGDPPGIVIKDGEGGDRVAAVPVIRAFIWGRKVRQVPTLPFGRWKMSAA